MLPLDHLAIPFSLLYAETHFRFLGISPSLLFRRAPEVIFDAPHRVAPQMDLPIMLLINDIDRFPASVGKLSVAISSPGSLPQKIDFKDIGENLLSHSLKHQSLVYLFKVPRERLRPGKNFITASIEISYAGRTKLVINDNLPYSSKRSFACFVSSNALPGKEFCSYGDLHVHTQYSQSHVEFGPPLSVTRAFAMAYGIDFIGATDHSYDLECEVEDFLAPARSAPRWSLLKDEVSAESSVMVILGEEVSALNSKSKVVHLLGLGMRDFIPGSLDGARKHRHRAHQFSVEETVCNLKNQNALSIAAHPAARATFLEGVLLKRGCWSVADFAPDLDGFQALNNSQLSSWERTKKLYSQLLMRGHRLSIIAGNDSHGDFNRYRCIGFPFMTIAEDFSRHFAGALTGVYGKPKSEKELLQLLREGKTFVTTGPYLAIAAGEGLQQIVGKKDTDRRALSLLHLSVLSSQEFGRILDTRLLCFRFGDQHESVLFSKGYSAETYSVKEQVSPKPLEGAGYIRMEARCLCGDGSICFGATSPCFYA